MAWVALLLSAVLEAVWATALGRSDGFSSVGWTIVFAIAVVASMVGLGIAMKAIPISIAYAIWTGVGAALTVAVAMITGDEPTSLLKILLLAGIIGSVIGLKLVEPPPKPETPA